MIFELKPSVKWLSNIVHKGHKWNHSKIGYTNLLLPVIDVFCNTLFGRSLRGGKSLTKKPPNQPQITFDKLEINVINESSGLFMDGPHSADHWRTYRKETTGWGHMNEGTLEEVYSIVKDNDGVDFVNSEDEPSRRPKGKS
jgi:hypothetical protein